MVESLSSININPSITTAATVAECARPTSFSSNVPKAPELWQMPEIDALIASTVDGTDAPLEFSESKLLSEFPISTSTDVEGGSHHATASGGSTKDDGRPLTEFSVSATAAYAYYQQPLAVYSTRPTYHRRAEPFKQPDPCKIFVGGLPNEVRNLKHYFEKDGDVVDHVVMIDRASKRSRGFGFVTFANEEDANKLLTSVPGRVGYVTILNKQCELKRCVPEVAKEEAIKMRKEKNLQRTKGRRKLRHQQHIQQQPHQQYQMMGCGGAHPFFPPHRVPQLMQYQPQQPPAFVDMQYMQFYAQQQQHHMANSPRQA